MYALNYSAAFLVGLLALLLEELISLLFPAVYGL